MPDWPVVPLFALLFAIACARGGLTYALARGVRGLADQRSRLLHRPMVRRGEELVRRYGPPAVTLCFLTVGIQTAVMAAAGSLRMPLARFLPALALGALIWATIYLTVGLAVLRAIWTGDVGTALLLVLVVAATVAVLTGLLRRRRTRD